MVKHLPTMQESSVRSLGWEDPLEKGMAFQYSCLENPMEGRSLVGYIPWGRKESDTTATSLSLNGTGCHDLSFLNVEL